MARRGTPITPTKIYVVYEQDTADYEADKTLMFATYSEKEAENVAKAMKGKVGHYEGLELVESVEDWTGWPDTPVGKRLRALAKLTPEDIEALGIKE